MADARTGLIRSYWDGYDRTYSQGTFSIVGKNDLLTATHVVYDPEKGGWADRFEFFFGLETDLNGNHISVSYTLELGDNFRWSVTGWPDQVYSDDDNDLLTSYESSYDVALIGLNIAVGETLGHYGLSADYNQSSFRAYSIGYTGGVLQQQFAKVHSGFYGGETYDTLYKVMGPGSSGGPLLVDNNVIGVKSAGGDSGSTWADFGFLWDQLTEAMSENDSLLSDTSTDTPTDDSSDSKNDNSDSKDDTPTTDGKNPTSFVGTDGIDLQYLDIAGEFSQVTIESSTQTSVSSKWQLTDHADADKVYNFSDIERLRLDEQHVALDLALTQSAGASLALTHAAFGALPDDATLGYWIAQADNLLQASDSKSGPILNGPAPLPDTLTRDLAGLMLDYYAPAGISNAALVAHLYKNVTGEAATGEIVKTFTTQMDEGLYSQAGMVVFAAEHELNTDQYTDLIGQGVTYDYWG